MPGPRVVLVGPPGSGKTSVGHALARLWGEPFRDTDHDVEQAAGKAVAEIFLDDGEQRFRELEREAVASALTEHEGVLSLGGGAVLDADTQARLATYARDGGEVVFLVVSLAQAAPRVGLNAARPLLAGNPRLRWKQLMDERRPVYEAVATRTVLTDGITPDAVAGEIAGGAA